MNSHINPKQADIASIPLWLAAVPLVALMAMLAGSVYIFGDDASSGPVQIALLFAAIIGIIMGLLRGQSWDEFEDAIINGIGLTMRACLILLMIGALIGAWMLAGTVPAIIDLGLSILSPQWFYPATMIICALVAVSIGSSWTTAATAGLALVGISQIMGLSVEVTAGAVISGAYFGDKLSPLSDSTNLAPAMVGVDLFVHIRHMLWTTTPSFLLAISMFVWIGWGGEASLASTSVITDVRETLAREFALGLPAFIPVVVLLGLAIRKVPALPTITIGMFTGCLVALTYQPELAQRFGDSSGAMSHGLALTKGLWTALSSGYEATTGNVQLDALLSRGGMGNMLVTIWLILSAMCFGAVMEHTGFLGKIAHTAMRGVRGTGSLIATTVFTAIGMNIIASDQYISLVLPGRMYAMEFKKRGLAPENLSRTLEDAGTMTSALVPWNTCGAFMAATLGVPTLAYAPYAFLNLFNPVIAIIYGILNVRINKL